MNEQKVAPLTKAIVALFFAAFAGVTVFAMASRAGSVAGGAGGSGFRDIGLSEAFDAADREGKLVFAHFTADWCPPCNMMAKGAYQDSQVLDWLEAETIPIKIDIDDHQDLAERYRATTIPTMIFFDRSGNEVDRWVGGMSASQFMKKAEDIR